MNVAEAYRCGVLDGLDLAVELLRDQAGGVGAVEVAAFKLREAKTRRLLMALGLTLRVVPDGDYEVGLEVSMDLE